MTDLPAPMPPGPMPVLKAVRNPQPVRDLARGIAFRSLPRLAAVLEDPNTPTIEFIKGLELLFKYSLGVPSPAEQAASVADGEVAEAKTLALLKQVLRDPGMREHVAREFPGLLKAVGEAVPDPVEPEG